jgi:hypothetical protein
MSAEITSLFTHKCSDHAHALGDLLSKALREAGIKLLVDPLRPGDDIETRMDSFEFDALLFLSEPESLASGPCRRELRTAKRRSVPVFVVALSGGSPDGFKQRLFWRLPPTSSSEFTSGIEVLGKVIRWRVELRRDLRILNVDRPPDETRKAAQKIALETDRSLVAEVVTVLVRRYRQLKDPTTRYWIALALGSAGTPKAERLLRKLPKDDHPYVLAGIRQAQDIIALGG